jgi:hypothetical protein
MSQSPCVRRLPLRSGYSMRHWPRFIATFFTWFGLVWERRQELCPCSNDFIYAYLFCLCPAPAASILEQRRCPRVVGRGD